VPFIHKDSFPEQTEEEKLACDAACSY